MKIPDELPDSIEESLLDLLGRSPAEFARCVERLCGEHPEIGSLIRREAAAMEQAARATVTPTLPTQIGPFEILSEIGQGGMGTVYLAQQKAPVKRRVALKVIKLGMDTKAVLARFEAERQALALMDHSSIAKVYEAGVTPEGRPYFAMEYVKGIPITRYCDDNRLSVEDRLALLRQVCSGVQHAHTKGIIHRDLTPNNVLVTVQDSKPTAKIIDFGLARATDHRLTEKTVFTEQGVIMGTPEYMSPEQAGLDGLDIDMRSDVYTLGVLLYELLTGALPFSRDQLRQAGYDQMCAIIRKQEPEKPSTKITKQARDTEALARLRRTDADKLMRRLRGDLDWVVLKCLEKDRTRRYETISELAADLLRHLEYEPVLARAPTVGYRLAKLAQRYRGQLMAAASVFAALIGGLGLATYFWLEAAGQATEAKRQAGIADSERREAKRQEAVAQNRAREADIARANEAAKAAEVIAREKEKRKEFYFACVAAATAALEWNEITNVRKYLEAAPEEDRGWEWHYLHAVTDDSLTVLRGHERGATRAVYSPDGTRILTVSRDKTAKVWDASTGGELVLLQGHEDVVLAGSFSPDGKRILTASSDDTARLWTVDGQLEAVLNAHKGDVLAATFSPDGSQLLTVSTDTTARLWDARTAMATAELSRFGRPMYGGLFSPDSTRVVTASDGTASLWNPRTARFIAFLRGHEQAIEALAFSYDSRRLVTGSRDKTARLWDALTGQQLAVLSGHEDSLSAVAFFADGSRVVTASQDKTARVWDAATGGRLALLRGHDGPLTAVAVSRDCKRIATASTDRTLRLWDASARELSVMRGHEDALSTVAFNPDGTRLLTSSSDGTARFWDAARPAAVLLGTRAILTRDGTHVLTVDSEAARLWDTRTGRELSVIRPPKNVIGHPSPLGRALSPDGSRVVTWSVLAGPSLWDAGTSLELSRLWDTDEEDRRPPTDVIVVFSPTNDKLVVLGRSAATLWDAKTGRSLGLLSKNETGFSTASFSPDGKRVLIGLRAGARIWDADTKQELAALQADTSSAVFSPDGTRLVSGRRPAVLWDAKTYQKMTALDELASSIAFNDDGAGLVTVSGKVAVSWNGRTGEKLAVLHGHEDSVRGAVFSPDGTRIVTASVDRTAILWNATSGHQLTVLRGHEDSLVTANWSPDGTRVVTASSDKTARVWDVGTGRQLIVLRGHDGPLYNAVFGPEGKWVLTWSQDGTCRIWHSVPHRIRRGGA